MSSILTIQPEENRWDTQQPSDLTAELLQTADDSKWPCVSWCIFINSALCECLDSGKEEKEKVDSQNV